MAGFLQTLGLRAEFRGDFLRFLSSGRERVAEFESLLSGARVSDIESPVGASSGGCFAIRPGRDVCPRALRRLLGAEDIREVLSPEVSGGSFGRRFSRRSHRQAAGHVRAEKVPRQGRSLGVSVLRFDRGDSGGSRKTRRVLFSQGRTGEVGRGSRGPRRALPRKVRRAGRREDHRDSALLRAPAASSQSRGKGVLRRRRMRAFQFPLAAGGSRRAVRGKAVRGVRGGDSRDSAGAVKRSAGGRSIPFRPVCPRPFARLSCPKAAFPRTWVPSWEVRRWC